MAPWTQRLILHWEPELRFYERGVSILRLLQDRGELQAFNVAPEALRGRLFNDQAELVLSRDRLDVTLWGPEVDAPRAWEAVVLTFGQLEPGRPTTFQVLLQHVLPLAAPPRDAIIGAYDRLFNFPGTEDVRFDDWAFLTDLAVADEHTASAGIEFGIVAPEEIPPRLARRVGGRVTRVSGVGTQGFLPDIDLGTFAAASLFSDSWWVGAYDRQAPFLRAALQFWERSRERANRVVEAIHASLNRDDDQRGRRTA